MLTKEHIIEVYGPQLGELVWHSLHVDSRIVAISEQHAASIVRAAAVARPSLIGSPPCILEVGAYAHFGAHLAASMLGGSSVAHDISPTSLRVGLEGVRAAGFDVESTLVAGDFHDIPFSTGYFDIVFCASSVHHTFRPWRVLREMLRVVRPGGVLQLENEPIGRELSFYGFRTNRPEEFTTFERAMADRGTLYTFASPVPGSRPEALFGMIENERIPLNMMLEPLSKGGDIQRLQILPQVGEFEQRILALPRDVDLEARLAALLLTELKVALSHMTDSDRMLGARLPTTDDVWRLVYRVGPMLRRLTDLSGREAEYETARLFGAAVQATVVKYGREDPALELFTRKLTKQDGVFNDLPTLPNIHLGLTDHLIPAIESADPESLIEVYPKDDWEFIHEANGVRSLLNLHPRNRIALPNMDAPAMLLLRFYAVATAQPYTVNLCDGLGRQIASSSVVQSESLLFRELIQAECRDLFVEIRSLDGAALSLPRHVRLAVMRLIPVRSEDTKM